MVPNPVIRHKVNRGLNTDEAAEPNVFAALAPAAAFGYGEAWLDELRTYLFENRTIAEHFLKEEIPKLYPVPSDATYLLWIDCTRLSDDLSDLCDFIRAYSGLYLCDGREYHNGTGFLRMNLACSREFLKDGLNRLKASIAAYQAKRNK